VGDESSSGAQAASRAEKETAGITIPRTLIETLKKESFYSAARSADSFDLSARAPLTLDWAPLRDHPALKKEHPDLQSFYALYKYTVQPPTVLSEDTANKVSELRITRKEERKATVIAGGVKMYDVKHIAAYKSSLAEDVLAVAREAASKAGVDWSNLKLAATKLLKVEPGAGDQVVHWDTGGAWTNTGSYAMILNCSEKTVSSTAFPRFSMPQEFQLDEPDTAAHGRVRLSRAQRERLAEQARHIKLRRLAFLLDPEWYHSIEFKRGEVGWFEQSIPHKGTRNDSNATRVVLFCLLQVPRMRETDENSYFRWMFMDEVGMSKQQYAEALMEDADETPVERYRCASQQTKARECLEQCSYTSAHQQRLGKPPENLLRRYEAIVAARR
jgi:hypothetical protein